MPCKQGWLSSKHGVHIQPFSANASEEERAAFEKLLPVVHGIEGLLNDCVTE